MYPLITASLVTAVTLLLDVRGKCVKHTYKYMVLFLLIAGIGFFFQGMKAEASEYYKYVRAQAGEIILNTGQEKSKNQIKKEFIETCFKKANYHFDEGCKYLKEAEEISLLWPNIHDFDKSQLCLVNIVATLAPGDPTYRAIGAVIALSGQYASLVMEEWQKFKMLLLQSKTHFEMEEYYRITGKYQYDIYMAEKREEKKK